MAPAIEVSGIRVYNIKELIYQFMNTVSTYIHITHTNSNVKYVYIHRNVSTLCYILSHICHHLQLPTVGSVRAGGTRRPVFLVFSFQGNLQNSRPFRIRILQSNYDRFALV